MSRKTLFLPSVILLLLSGVGGAGADPAPVAFQDTYTRNDAAPPQDSLGTTESGSGLTMLDYREIDADGGIPVVSDVAMVDGQSLFVAGRATNPSFVELSGLDRDVDLAVVAEFATTDLDAWEAANIMTFALRNTGVAADGSIFTPGMVLVEIETDGYYQVRGVAPDAMSVILLAHGYIDPATLAILDADADGRLESGERFAVRITIEDDWLDVRLGGALQVEGLDLSGLPEPPPSGDRLLVGRNRRDADNDPVNVRFDDLRTLADAVDGDGDGIPAGQDCDDADPSTYPGASEACDAVDNDCDGTVPGDELDGDGDGLAACAGDCDDADASVHPGAVDLPGNALDEDCDGEATCDASGPWRNHGQYVSCVARAVKRLERRGLIGQDQAHALVRDAARSDVGKTGHGGGLAGSSSGGGEQRANGGGGRR